MELLGHSVELGGADLSEEEHATVWKRDAALAASEQGHAPCKTVTPSESVAELVTQPAFSSGLVDAAEFKRDLADLAMNFQIERGVPAIAAIRSDEVLAGIRSGAGAARRGVGHRSLIAVAAVSRSFLQQGPQGGSSFGLFKILLRYCNYVRRC